jgi:hypothetical protein
MAFFHEDGLIPAWNFAKRYAGRSGRIATLPDIIEARLRTRPGDLPWETYFTTNSAEYYGVGADGREKIIVAHGVGPMSTLEGIKRAYSWQYKDKDRRRQGGRITAVEFLQLEAGDYGDVAVIDYRQHVENWGFYQEYLPAAEAVRIPLLVARLGQQTARPYLMAHQRHARRWCKECSITVEQGGPYVIRSQDPSNLHYESYAEVNGRMDITQPIPRPLEPDMAIGHLLSISGLVHTHFGYGQGLVCEVHCHGWGDGARFVGMPADKSWDDGLAELPRPHEVLRREWQRFLRPNNDEVYVPPRLYLIEWTGSEWFTRCSKEPGVERLDEGDIEFHVDSVSRLGEPRQFTVDDDFFLRYDLAQVVALAVEGANAYEIVSWDPKDSRGLTTVTVQFYEADVNTSRRLPRVKEIKQNYNLLMG